MIQIVEFCCQLGDAEVGEKFKEEILDRYVGKLLVLWFWLPYCPACLIMENHPQKMPIVTADAEADAIFCKINVDDIYAGNQLIYALFRKETGLEGLPAFVFLKKLTILGGLEGAVDGEDLLQAIVKGNSY